MSSRLTMVLASVFFVAALLAGYWGLMLSRPAPAPVVAAPSVAVDPQQPPPVAPAPVAQPHRSPVVVVRRAVPAYTPLTEDDLLVEQLQVAPAGAYQQIEQVLGRSSSRALAEGTWLDVQTFQAAGPLARMIRPNERAVAVAVDDVIGAGGQLSPGDYVDVLLFLREDAANPQASAQVVLPALRVLSVDRQVGLANDGRPALSAQEQQDSRRDAVGNNTRTVALAVPQALASRLMLAAQAGTLRLAVRSADERLASLDPAEPLSQRLDRDLYRFNQLAQVPVAKAAAPGRAPGMQVIRGAQTDTRPSSP
ncbi:Flp pilus assembly protein CpaB [Enterobacterales bacterium BD_CKDN230030183-1A_HGKHYDSX7]